MPFNRHILHVDMDAFFVSVERLLNPVLNGKPVIVGGNPDGHGVVACASYEARAFGIHSAMPITQARRLCPNAIFIRGHYEAYAEYSDKIRTIFESYSPLVEMGSLDEAYIDLTGTERLHGHALRAAHAIHHRIRSELRLPCSLGLASNKLIAKVASCLAKPNGLLYVLTGKERTFLSPLPLRRLPGIGPKTARRLQLYGLRTIGDITFLGKPLLEQLFGSYGSALYESALGMSGSSFPKGSLRMVHDVESKIATCLVGRQVSGQKSIGREHTFDPRNRGDPAVILSTLSYLSEKVAAELRELNARAKTITLKLRYVDFKTITRSLTLAGSTDDECELFRVGKSLFEKYYTGRGSRFRGRVSIRLVGISANCLFCRRSRSKRSEDPDFGEGQLDLLVEDHVSPKNSCRSKIVSQLHRSIDKVRRRYGFQSILHASSFAYPKGILTDRRHSTLS